MHVNQDVNQKTRMNASVSVVCYKSKTLSNGESPLMLQVSKSGKRKYQSLGISIKPRYWDFTRNKPKPNCPNKDYIQKIILDKQTELQQRMLELNSEQSLMFRTLRSTYNKAIKAKCARKSEYPFDEFKINKFDVSTQKRTIAKTEVLKFTKDICPIGKRQ